MVARMSVRTLLAGLVFALAIAGCGSQPGTRAQPPRTAPAPAVAAAKTVADTAPAAQDTAAQKPAAVKTVTIVDPAFPESTFFGIWTTDPNGPHADFKLSRECYLAVDYDGDGRFGYSVKGDSLAVFLDGFTSRGRILLARNDSLQVAWETRGAETYVRWKQ